MTNQNPGQGGQQGGGGQQKPGQQQQEPGRQGGQGGQQNQHTGKTPIVVDLGKSSRKRIKRLKRGEGKLMQDVNEELAQLQARGEIPPNGGVVVFVVERRSGSSGWSMPMPMPMPKMFPMKW